MMRFYLGHSMEISLLTGEILFVFYMACYKSGAILFAFIWRATSLEQYYLHFICHAASHTTRIIFLQIRDYCNCLSQKASTALAETSPTIYRVLLQMCAEDSKSNESWAYKDMLVSKSARKKF